jgi:hypothetical protein
MHLKQHVLQQVEERFGEVMCASTKIEYILTVPAVWSEAAKDATMRAAELAGMNEDSNCPWSPSPKLPLFVLSRPLQVSMPRRTMSGSFVTLVVVSGSVSCVTSLRC